MKVSVTFRNVSENESLSKSYIEEKLLKFKKYFDKPVDVQVVISLEKFRYDVEINMTTAKHPAFSKVEAKNPRLAFDNACDKLERQFKKQLERMRASNESFKETKDEEEFLDSADIE